jgi:predicted regulator of Ras-like GTPase activity (Roadblock/LC7/MglB family)
MLADALNKIVENTPGAAGAILMGFDGIAVMQHMNEAFAERDLESIAMEMSFRFMELRKAAEALDLGPISDITVKADGGTILCRVLSDEYFVCALLDDPAHFGKGRWILRSTAASLNEDL